MVVIILLHFVIWSVPSYGIQTLHPLNGSIVTGLSGDPTVSCHTRYVAEGKSLDCDCRLSHFSNSHSSDILLTWPGYSDNSVLKVMNVTRTDNGTVFTCLMIRGEQKKTANYTLQVACKSFSFLRIVYLHFINTASVKPLLFCGGGCCCRCCCCLTFLSMTIFVR